MEMLRNYAMRLVGVYYIWGGDNIKGFDCSGLVIELLKSIGAFPLEDATAQGLYDYYKANGATEHTWGFGALVFFGDSVKAITHVAMMMDDSRVIHASKKAGFVQIRPANNVGKKIVSILMPDYYKYQLANKMISY